MLYKLELHRRLRHWDDERYLKLMYRIRMGRRLNLDNAESYSEKLQWLKLNYRDPATIPLVDKAAVKSWVADRIGSEHVIPTLAEYASPDEIDLDALPESFVIKSTHDSGGVVVVRDKRELDLDQVKSKLQRSLSRNYFYLGREPQYRDLVPRIIAESFITSTADGQLRDFKFFCFNGEMKIMLVVSDRETGNAKSDFFDSAFTPLDLQWGAPGSSTPPPRPQHLDRMIAIAETLSDGVPHVRVDLYEVDGRIYFGEMTFFPTSGLRPMSPRAWDKKMGEWLNLPKPITNH